MFRIPRPLGLPVLLLALALPAQAKVSQSEAERLGRDLTPVGAEQAGNADGGIPPWQGRAAWAPDSFDLSYQDMSKLWKAKPDAIDTLLQPGPVEPLLTITAANWKTHRERLTLAHQALFQRYPDYAMTVYGSARGAFVPSGIETATRANATRASLSGTDDLQGAQLGFPFPIPGSGAEVIWNHKLRYRGAGIRRYNNQLIVDKDGDFTEAKIVEDVKSVYANLEQPPAADSNVILYYLQEIVAPRRVAGQLTLVHEILDQTSGGRNAWLYNPGQGRVRRAPNVGYDNPAASSDGLMFNDQQDMFNGALDRYSWTLKGKQDLYIPYNSAWLNSPNSDYQKIVRPRFVNPELARYELHRVWVVEATLREGLRHSFSRRVFYIDEDSWAIAAVANFDGRGEVWRVQEAHLTSFPMVGATAGFPEIHYDLQSGRYFVQALYAEDQIPDFGARFEDRHFQSRQLRYQSRGR